MSARLAHFETVLPIHEVEVVPAGCAVVSSPFSFEGIIRGTVRTSGVGRKEDCASISCKLTARKKVTIGRKNQIPKDGMNSGIEPGRYRA